MHGHDIAIAFIMLFIPAFLGSLRDAGLGNLRVTRTRAQEKTMAKLIPQVKGEDGKIVRVTLVLSAADEATFDTLPYRSRRWVKVTDTATGAEWEIRQAACGSGCYCDAEARPAVKR